MNKPATLFPVLIITMIVTSCSRAPDIDIPDHIRQLDNLTVYTEIPDPPPLMDLVHEMNFGDTDEVLIGRIGNIVADDEGRVFIGDPQQQTIHVFRPDGTYLTNIGRQGNGPGEFQIITGIQIRSGRLYAADFPQRRMNVYSLEDFSFMHTINLIPANLGEVETLAGFNPSVYLVRQDGNILTGFRSNTTIDRPGNEREFPFYITDRDGNIISGEILKQGDLTFLSDPGGTMQSTFGFTPAPFRVLADDDRIFSAWSEDFLIKVHSPDGTYRRSFYYPFEKRMVNRDELLEEFQNETHQRMLRSNDLPETWPALDNMMIDDDNNLWISTIDENEEMDDWWMLNEQGELQGIMRIDGDRNIREIKDGRVYLLETDDESGQQQLARYRITISSPGPGE